MRVTEATTTTPLAPDLSLETFTLTVDQVQAWLVTVGLRILITIVLAVVAAAARGQQQGRAGQRRDGLDDRAAPVGPHMLLLFAPHPDRGTGLVHPVRLRVP